MGRVGGTKIGIAVVIAMAILAVLLSGCIDLDESVSDSPTPVSSPSGGPIGTAGVVVASNENGGIVKCNGFEVQTIGKFKEFGLDDPEKKYSTRIPLLFIK